MKHLLFWQRISLVIYTIGTLLFGIPCFFYGQITFLSVIGLLVFAAAIAADIIKMRCPFCHHFLGLAPSGKYCPHCGDQIKP